jgi:sialate O-acetylesterase
LTIFFAGDRLTKVKFPLLSSLFFALILSVQAEVKLPAIFADHMVLQRQMPATVWGWASPGEKVSVEFAGSKVEITADATGSWKAELPPLEASAEGRSLTVKGSNTLTVNDVLVGEVWLCSGQSNMEWALGRSDGGTNACATTNPLLRLCTIPHNSQSEPASDVNAKWVISGDPSMKFFSAIGWWFGDKLQKELKVPVAILNDSYGGTTIQAWMPVGALRSGPWPQDIRWNNPELAKAEYDKKKAELQPAYDKYLADKAAAAQNHQPSPEPPKGWPGDYRGPGVLWNGMIHPLLPLRFRGVCWYQGENNSYVGIANTYGLMLPVMIAEWRHAFAQPDLPFLVFQLARNRKPQVDPNEASGIAVIQEAQLQSVAKTPHTALIVTEDLGETNVHYLKKEPAAQRAFNLALSQVYGQGGDAFCPAFKSIEIKGDQCVLTIDHAADGMKAEGGTAKAFTVAGEDRKFVFADAVIEGDKVRVSSPSVSKPAAVRYAWADMPDVNMFNAQGLPLSPFRTDNWPLPETGGFSVSQPTPTPPPVQHP